MNKINLKKYIYLGISLTLITVGVVFTFLYITSNNNLTDINEDIENFNDIWNPFYGFNLIEPTSDDLSTINALGISYQNTPLSFTDKVVTYDNPFISDEHYRIIWDAVTTSEGVYQSGDDYQVLKLYLRQNDEVYPFLFRVYYYIPQLTGVKTIRYSIANIEVNEQYINVDDSIDLSGFLTRDEIYEYELGLYSQKRKTIQFMEVSLYLFIASYSVSIVAIVFLIFSIYKFKKYQIFENAADAEEHYNELTKLKKELKSKEKEKAKLAALEKKKEELEKIKEQLKK